MVIERRKDNKNRVLKENIRGQTERLSISGEISEERDIPYMLKRLMN